MMLLWFDLLYLVGFNLPNLQMIAGTLVLLRSFNARCAESGKVELHLAK